MAKQKRISPRKVRNLVVLDMLEHCKGGSMRDRRLRRDRQRAEKWRDEMYDEVGC
jgi:hypothetical protein